MPKVHKASRPSGCLMFLEVDDWGERLMRAVCDAIQNLNATTEEKLNYSFKIIDLFSQNKAFRSPDSRVTYHDECVIVLSKKPSADLISLMKKIGAEDFYKAVGRHG